MKAELGHPFPIIGATHGRIPVLRQLVVLVELSSNA